MRTKYFILLLFLSCLACNDRNESNGDKAYERTNTVIDFDKTKWRTKDHWDYPHRNEMLEDLMSNQNLKALKRDQILDLLGKPTRIDSNYLFYMVDQKRIGYFPLNTKTLVIKLSPDSTVDWVKIHE